MIKKNTEVILAKEAKIVNVVMPDANMEPAGRINYFHRVTKEAGKLSIAAAFYAGLELMRVKENVTQHGEFGKWIESNCDFSERSAQNYIHVAYMCLSKAGYDCDDLIEGTDATRIKAIEDATDKCESNSLNDIYIDLGIVSKSKSRMGGKREGAGRKRKEDLAAQAEAIAGEGCRFQINALVKDLFIAAVTNDEFGAFKDAELKAHVETLEKIVARGKEILKSRKAK